VTLLGHRIRPGVSPPDRRHSAEAVSTSYTSNTTVVVARDGTLTILGAEDPILESVPPEARSVGLVDARVGAHHAVALLRSGNVVAWGSAIRALDVPDSVRTGGNDVAISVGDLQNLALLSDGSVLSWCYHPSIGGCTTPQSLSSQRIVAISAGTMFSLAH
jgi:alpha-tubulin suppressor-like RCC1 family protein